MDINNINLATLLKQNPETLSFITDLQSNDKLIHLSDKLIHLSDKLINLDNNTLKVLTELKDINK